MTTINNRQIKAVKDGQRPKGEHSILLDCTDQYVTSGGYLKERLDDEKAVARLSKKVVCVVAIEVNETVVL